MPSNGYQRYTPDEQRKRRIRRLIIEVIVCAVLILPTIFVPVGSLLKDMIKPRIFGKVTLQPDTEGLQSWLDPPVDTTRSYYLFNVTNAENVTLHPSDTTIHVRDTPAYTYKIKTIKNITQWSDNNTKLDYEVSRLITRDPERFKESSLNDTGAFIDLVRAIFRTQFEKAKPAQSFFDLGGENPFPEGKPIELLEGYTSSLFDTVREKMVGPNTDKSGFIYRQNGSRLYSVSIDTDLDKKGQMKSFSSDLVAFETTSHDYSFPIYDSVTYPTMLFDKPVLNIFHSDFCSPVLLQYSKTVNLRFGLPAFEYRVKFINVNNCSNPNDTSTCEEVQKLDVSKCISTSLPEDTIFLSKAHFYGSKNETIQEMNIEGFQPSADAHDSVVYFEPYSGTPLKASFRMQLNVAASIDPARKEEDGAKWTAIKKRKGVVRLIPVFWIDQDIKLYESKVKDLQKAMIIMNNGQRIVIGLAIVLSICFILVMELVPRLCNRNNRNKHSGYVKADTLIYH
ncbi:unnamed protein product [Adineta ricciae]|uniref:Uncharacterized protein n=1 Tax=Adineta ricciae TaxID=249248 RepID=A0A814FLZ2_ADIRI|nr:unnamed protein product [Adineta ricciae]